jgi:hypothetical protein
MNIIWKNLIIKMTYKHYRRMIRLGELDSSLSNTLNRCKYIDKMFLMKNYKIIREDYGTTVIFDFKIFKQGAFYILVNKDSFEIKSIHVYNIFLVDFVDKISFSITVDDLEKFIRDLIQVELKLKIGSYYIE